MPLPDVSRETINRLRIFESLVGKWTPSINLVSRGDRSNIWDRHVLDSVQIFHSAPKPFENWVDLGSGGGFPGIVVAILAMNIAPDALVTLVESDGRKAAFLRTALRETGVRGRVINERIGNIPPLQADVLSARALAELSVLFEHAERHLAPRGTCVFAKGERWLDEVKAVKSRWRFEHRVVTSKSNPNAGILIIKDLTRA